MLYRRVVRASSAPGHPQICACQASCTLARLPAAQSHRHSAPASRRAARPDLQPSLRWCTLDHHQLRVVCRLGGLGMWRLAGLQKCLPTCSRRNVRSKRCIMVNWTQSEQPMGPAQRVPSCTRNAGIAHSERRHTWQTHFENARDRGTAPTRQIQIASKVASPQRRAHRPAMLYAGPCCSALPTSTPYSAGPGPSSCDCCCCRCASGTLNAGPASTGGAAYSPGAGVPVSFVC